MEVIAHRGASARRPEHTFAAYELALALGAHTLELDLHRRPVDGRVVVQHDPLRPGDDPLLLDDVLARFAGRTRWLLELKTPCGAEVLAAVLRAGVADDVVVQSFDHAALGACDRRLPCVALCPDASSAWDVVQRPGRLRGISVLHTALHAPLVDRAQATGLTVYGWTANAPAEVERLVRLGVDGVITDLPDADAAAAPGVPVLVAA